MVPAEIARAGELERSIVALEEDKAYRDSEAT
jgi:hypothetical protein